MIVSESQAFAFSTPQLTQTTSKLYPRSKKLPLACNIQHPLIVLNSIPVLTAGNVELLRNFSQLAHRF